MDEITPRLKVAILTPTYQRDHFLQQTQRYVEQQVLHNIDYHWFVLDDSPHNSKHLQDFNQNPNISYYWLENKKTLGYKRNMLNQMALNWGANIICNMDDDDWYGANYVQEMTKLLCSADEIKFVGSGRDFYYDLKSNRVLDIPSVRDFSSCNGVLCYKIEILKSHHYQDEASFAEEQYFLNSEKVYQYQNIQKLHLALAHPNNTVTKKNYCYGDRYLSNLTLDDFPMRNEDREFYRDLHEQYQLKI